MEVLNATMDDYDNLIDIHSCKIREKSSRIDNATFFIEQLQNHKLFKVGDDVVEINFLETNKTFSDILISHLTRQNSKQT